MSEKTAEEKSELMDQIEDMLAKFDQLIPFGWTKGQVASVFNLYLEVYR